MGSLMKLHKFEERPLAWSLVALAVVLHLATLHLPLVNLEWAFVDAARYFATGNQDLIDLYFSVQANTLATSILAWAIQKHLSFLPIEYVPRLLSISGFFFLGAALLRINSLLGRKIHPAILLLLVFSNPLIWIFGGRGTADFLSPCLALFSVSLFLNRPKGFQIVLPIICFGVATVLKYHAVLLLPLVFLDLITDSQSNLRCSVKRCLVVGTGISIIPIFFILWMHERFGFWLTPPAFQSIHGMFFEMENIFSTAVSYLGYFTLMLVPFSLAIPFTKIHKARDFLIMSGLVCLALIFGFFFIKNTGEMNFGPLDGRLDVRLINGAFCVGAGLLLANLWNGVRFYNSNPEERKRILVLMAGILFFIGVLAFSRPAQRYLIYLLPLGYFFVFPALAHRRVLVPAALIVCMLMNLFLLLHQESTGKAASQITSQLIQKKLIDVTDPGAVLGHTGNRFPQNSLPRKYIVVVGNRSDQLFAVQSGAFPFIRKTYSVIPARD
jgi:hypothetical protein